MDSFLIEQEANTTFVECSNFYIYLLTGSYLKFVMKCSWDKKNYISGPSLRSKLSLQALCHYEVMKYEGLLKIAIRCFTVLGKIAHIHAQTSICNSPFAHRNFSHCKQKWD